MKKVYSSLWLAGVILTSLAGVAAFIYVSLIDFNLYWYILSPVIFPFYQAPAIFLYWLWKKKKREKEN